MTGTSVVEVATTRLERSGEGQKGWSAHKTIQHFSDGTTWCRWRFPSLLGIWVFCGISPFVYRMVAIRSGSWALETVCLNWDKPFLGVANVGTQWRCISSHQQPRGRNSARHVGGLLSVDGFDRRRMVVVASSGDEMEREGIGVHLVLFLSVSRPGMFLVRCLHGTVLDMVGRSRITARMDVDVAAAKSASWKNGIARRAAWNAGAAT